MKKLKLLLITFLFSNCFSAIGQEYRYGFIDKTGKVAIKPLYDDAGNFHEGLTWIKNGNIISIIDKSGNIIIKLPQFQRIDDFYEGLAEVTEIEVVEGRRYYKTGFINKSGNIVIKPQSQFQTVWHFCDGLARVRPPFEKAVDVKYLYINIRGKIASDQFDAAADLKEGLGKIKKDGKYGFIDNTGKIVIRPQFGTARDFSEGLAAIRVDEEWGFVDKTGKIVIETQYEFARSFSDGLAEVKNNGMWGFIDKKGNVVIDFQFYSVSKFSEGLAGVGLKNEKFAFINKTGKVVFELSSNVYPLDAEFHEGLTAIKDYEKGYGFMDRQGTFLIAPMFEEADRFYDGLAKVKLNGLWGFIDKTGKIVIEPQFKEAYSFHDGLARIHIDISKAARTTNQLQDTEQKEEASVQTIIDPGSDNTIFIFKLAQQLGLDDPNNVLDNDGAEDMVAVCNTNGIKDIDGNIPDSHYDRLGIDALRELSKYYDFQIKRKESNSETSTANAHINEPAISKEKDNYQNADYSAVHIRAETTKYLERCKGSMTYLFSGKTPAMCSNAPYKGTKKSFDPEIRDKNTYSGKVYVYFSGTNNVHQIAYYSQGQITKQIVLHPDGSIYTIMKFRNGKRQADAIYVDRQGKIILIGSYENDKPSDTWYTPTWWQNGFPVNSTYAQSQFPGALDEIGQILKFYISNHYRFMGNLDIQNCK